MARKSLSRRRATQVIAGAVVAAAVPRVAFAGRRIRGDPRITFSRGADNPVTSALALLAERMIVALDIEINVRATTNGQHSPASYHYSGRAIDINRVDGVPVAVSGEVCRVQAWLDKQPEVVENFGPCRKRARSQHRGHIHCAVKL